MRYWRIPRLRVFATTSQRSSLGPVHSDRTKDIPDANSMNRLKAEAIRLLLVASLFCFSLAIESCNNYTPEQIAAVTTGITSVVTTTGAVVTPMVLNLENGQSVKAKKVKVVTAKPTPTPTPTL